MKRRDFLKRTAIGGAALAVVPMSLVSSKPKDSWHKKNVEKIFKTNEERAYPNVQEFWEHGMMNPSDGITSHLKVDNSHTRYHLITNVPNRYDKGGYTICRRTYNFNNASWKHKDQIIKEEMEMIREDAERVMHNKKYTFSDSDYDKI